jgi:hypothetical protein
MSKAAELAALIGSQTALSNRNLIINGAMQVDQRNNGSSITVPNAVNTYVPDRFRINESSGAEFTAQRVDDAPVGFEYSSKITVSTADTSLGAAEFNRMVHAIEGQNISHLNWGTSNAKTLTLTFYVKSSVTGQYYISVFNSAANRTLLKGYTINSANTWEKKTITIIGDQTGTWLTTNGAGIYLMWSLGSGSNYQSNTLDAYQASFAMAKSDQVNFAASVSSTWQLTGVQLEVGEQDTPFEHRSFADELARCQRYYSQYDATNGGWVGSGFFYNTTAVEATIRLPQRMRAAPTVSIGGTENHIAIQRAATSNAGAGSSSAGNVTTVAYKFATTADGSSTTGNGTNLYVQNTAILKHDAEL